MKNIFMLIALLMTNMAFAQEAPQTIMCPLDNGTPVKINLKSNFLDFNPNGRISFFQKDGLEFPIVDVICTGRFHPSYQGGMSCVGLALGRIVRVDIDQHFVGGDIQNDSYVASVLVETSSRNEMSLLVKKSLCTVK
jgi:hypothetical protein